MVPLSYTPGPPGACLCPAGREQIEGAGHGILAYLQLCCLAQGQEKEREETEAGRRAVGGGGRWGERGGDFGADSAQSSGEAGVGLTLAALALRAPHSALHLPVTEYFAEAETKV